MLAIKIIIYIFIFATTSAIGILKAKKYVYRVDELRDIKLALNMFNTKLRFTCEPIPEIFQDISENFNFNVGNIFKMACKAMEKEDASVAWNTAIDLSILNINEEDKEILKNLSNLLGKTDLEGQIKQIELTENFIDEQIIKAEKERQNNEKLYRTLGISIGIAIVIVLL